MTTEGTIDTEIEEAEPTSETVETQLVSTEDFVFHDIPVTRETTVKILKSGGLRFEQTTNHDTHNWITLGSEVVERLVDELKEQ